MDPATMAIIQQLLGQAPQAQQQQQQIQGQPNSSAMGQQLLGGQQYAGNAVNPQMQQMSAAQALNNWNMPIQQNQPRQQGMFG